MPDPSPNNHREAIASTEERLRTRLADVPPERGYMALRVDFEEVLEDDHGATPESHQRVFSSLDRLPNPAARLHHLIHLVAAYIVARNQGLIAPTSTSDTA